MPHIQIREGLPGIIGLLDYKPPTGGRLSAFIQQLLRGDSPLTPAEREAIAAHVSWLNSCEFCARSHQSAARHLGHTTPPSTPEPDPKLAALLQLATDVATGGRYVTEEHVAAAREVGASDEAIHDAVLVASAFCMLNRYVDGLATVTPDDEREYDEMGAVLAAVGYDRLR